MIHTEITSGMNTLTVSQHGLSVTVCDDEGEFHRHEFTTSQALELSRAIIEHCAEWKPKIVCYCGSFKMAYDAFKKAEHNSVITNEIALFPCFMQGTPITETTHKEMADKLHRSKIDIADEVFVLNVGGYIGESTRNEIEYAISKGKPVKYLEPIPQPKP